MVQKIFGLGIGGSGIVAVLVVAGILINTTGNTPEIGNLSLTGGVVIGIALGGLGVLSVTRRFLRI